MTKPTAEIDLSKLEQRVAALEELANPTVPEQPQEPDYTCPVPGCGARLLTAPTLAGVVTGCQHSYREMVAAAAQREGREEAREELARMFLPYGPIADAFRAHVFAAEKGCPK
jgi:hypothetical protein